MEPSTANLSTALPVLTVTCPRMAATSSPFWFAEPSSRLALSELGSPLSTRSHGCRRTVVGRVGRSGEVETVEVHDLVPRRDEVTHELLLRVVTRVELRDASELGVRTEDKVDGGARPLDLARLAVATLVHVLGRGGRLPLRAHVEQVEEEVVGQRLGPVREHAVL